MGVIDYEIGRKFERNVLKLIVWIKLQSKSLTEVF